MNSIKPSRFLQGIQSLRGVFAVLVVCHHVGVHSQRFCKHDWLGGIFNQSTFRVDFFFVLSGFVLWLSHQNHAGEKYSSPLFLWRRLWRLYPLLFVLSCTKLLILCLLPSRSQDSYSVFSSLFALPQQFFPIIVAAWTIPFEIYFTMVMSVCLILRKRFALSLLMLYYITAISLGILCDTKPSNYGLGFLSHPFMLEFIAGVLAAELVLKKENKFLGIFMVTISILLLIWATVRHNVIINLDLLSQKCFWGCVFAVGLAGLFLWERATSASKWHFRDKWGLGKYSYSIFLGHGFVLMAAFAFMDAQIFQSHPIISDGILVFIVIFAVFFGCCLGRCVEKPLNYLISKKIPGIDSSAKKS